MTRAVCCGDRDKCPINSHQKPRYATHEKYHPIFSHQQGKKCEWLGTFVTCKLDAKRGQECVLGGRGYKAREILSGGFWVEGGGWGSNGTGDGLFHPQVRDQDRKYSD